jgi:hypothetical protein
LFGKAQLIAFGGESRERVALGGGSRKRRERREQENQVLRT